MRRIIIRALFAALLVLGWQRAWGFAFLGPFFGPDATWQTITLGYGLAYENAGLPGGPVYLGDVGGPKNLGEAFRRNDPYIFYAYDSTFSGYFGLQGETNADQAFALMNNVFDAYPSGVDGYSPNLTEFPFDSQDFNGTAQGYYLTDLKSVILHLLVEQMGLAQPERYTWTLHDRVVISPIPCPVGNQYLVVQRNYGYQDQAFTGPQTGTIYSPYVNNILYTYDILEDCGHHGPAWTAVTVPFSVDTTIPEYTAVAANNFEGGVISGLGGLQIGGFYTGLTEDDVAGLRYLMSSNNIEYENPATGSELEVTNAQAPVFIFPLYPLLAFAQTNPPANVLAFAAAQGYPNLVIDPFFTNTYTLVTNWIVNSYFTNVIGQSASSFPVFVVVTNGFTLSWQTNYFYTFDNMVLFDFHQNTPAYLRTISLQAVIGGPAGEVYTNVNNQLVILTNQPSGQFFLLPTNSCGIDIVYTNFLNAFDGYYTNFTTAASNTLTAETGFVGSESLIVPLTNSFVQGLECNLVASNGPAHYRGIQHINFVRISDNNVDPLTDLFRVPVTNTYTMTVVSNFIQYHQTFYRVVVQPDIVLSAFDDAQPNTFNGTVVRTPPNFDTGTVQPGLSGPGVINGPVQFDFNKVGTAWWNGPFSDTNDLLFGTQSEVNQTTGVPSLLWASFDGTTNTPTLYPNTASLQELQSQMVISISPTSLPPGTAKQAYGPVYFNATGGTGPYTWSVAPNSNLPLGLALFGNTLAGTPEVTNGTYDVSIQLMDSSNPTNVVTTPYTITIN